MMLMTSYRVFIWWFHLLFLVYWKVHSNTVILVYRLSKSIEKQQSYGVLLHVVIKCSLCPLDANYLPLMSTKQ